MVDMVWLQGWYNWPFLFLMALAVSFTLIDLILGGFSEVLGDLSGLDHDAPEFDAGDHGFMMWLGLGKVPISVLLQILFISFAGTGLVINAVWSEFSGPSTWWYSALVAYPVAASVSLFMTRTLGSKIAKATPADSTISRPAGGFVREVGVATSTITGRSGQVRIDGTGNIPDVTLNVRSSDSVADNITRGTQVIVEGYNEATNTYIVAPLEQ